MFTADQYKAKLQELSDLKDKVQLAVDPTTVGLSSFNEKLALIQQCRERISALSLEALWNKAEAEQALEIAKADYEQKFSGLLSTDAAIKNLRSNDMRKAQIDTQLTSEVSQFQQATLSFAYAEAFYKSVQVVDKLYEVKNNNLLQQILVTRMMLQIDPALRDELKVSIK